MNFQLVLQLVALLVLPPSLVAQSKYVCGVEGYSFYSDYPCNYYPICANGGFKLFVGCSNDSTCALYAANAVCVQQCCCTRPTIVSPVPPNPTVYNAAPRATLLLAAQLIYVVLVR